MDVRKNNSLNMNNATDNEKVLYDNYIKLAKIHSAVFSFNLEDERYLDKLLDRTNDINYDVSAYAQYTSRNSFDTVDNSGLHSTLKISGSYQYRQMQVFLKHGIDPIMKNTAGLTVLHRLLASSSEDEMQRAMVSNKKCIDLLLSAQVTSNRPENPCDENGLSHFHIACAANHSAAVEFFLRNGVNVDSIIDANSPTFAQCNSLHLAVQFGAQEVIRILLEHGVDARHENAEGLNPVLKFLEQRRKLGLWIDHRRPDSESIFCSRVDENEKIMKLLLQTVDELDLHLVCTARNSSLVKEYLELDNSVDIDKIINMNSSVCAGYTPLHFAALFDLETVVLLVERGANLLSKNADGSTPFDFCLKNFPVIDTHRIMSTSPISKNIRMSDGETKLLDLVLSMQDPVLLKSFLEAHGKKRLFVPHLDTDFWAGYTPLHIAVALTERKNKPYKTRKTRHSKDRSAIELCLGWNRTAVNIPDARGSTPLHLAFRLNKACLTDLLWKSRGNSKENLVDENNLSYLHIACVILDRVPTTGLLFDHNIDERVRSRHEWKKLSRFYSNDSLIIKPGYTALHIAVAGYKDQIVRDLVDRGANVNLIDDDKGASPIHYSMYRPQRQLADPLLSSSNIQDIVAREGGLSHLHVAVEFNNSRAARRLLQLGADVNAVITGDCQILSSYWTRCCIGYTPLHFAIDNRNLKMTDLLMRNGADILANVDFLRNALQRPFFIDSLLSDRIKKFTGANELQFACYLQDVTSVRALLRHKREDVNVRVDAKSPIWPHWTALHFLMWSAAKQLICEPNDSGRMGPVDVILKLLLENGADISLTIVSHDTPVHMLDSLLIYDNDNFDKAISRWIRVMLNRCKNFRANPANISDGVTLFHIACRRNELTAVKKFLVHGEVDVNRPTDHFASPYGGSSPLHLSLMSENNESKLKVIDLLLKYGADVRAENRYGDTPLHYAVLHCPNQQLFEKLIDAGADVHATNVLGKTPLETLLNTRSFTSNDLNFFFRRGYNRSYFNDVTEKGFAAYIFDKKFDGEEQKLLWNAMINAPGFCEADQMGRTALHNIASCAEPSITHRQYMGIIEKLVKRGCDVDDQDLSGRTALHRATLFGNHQAVAALIMSSADINIIDDNGKTAYSYSLKPYKAMYDNGDYCGIDKDDDIKFVFKFLTNHVKQLQLLNLRVNEVNVKVQHDVTGHGLLKEHINETMEYLKICKNYNNCGMYDEEAIDELMKLKNIIIGSSSLTLNDCLSETFVVATYPTMMQEEREAIDKYFRTSNADKLRKTFGKYGKFLKLQYRKAVARKSLIKPAENSLTSLTGFVLVEIHKKNALF